MTIAKDWYGTDDADVFIFNDDDVSDHVWAAGGKDYLADGKDDPWSNDDFYGQGGGDTIISRSGFDLLNGGAGDDTLKVVSARYDANHIPGLPAIPGNDWRGFDVEVRGGDGYDVLRITNTDVYTVETDGDWTFITTRFGGVISVRGVEHVYMTDAGTDFAI